MFDFENITFRPCSSVSLMYLIMFLSVWCQSNAEVKASLCQKISLSDNCSSAETEVNFKLGLAPNLRLPNPDKTLYK